MTMLINSYRGDKKLPAQTVAAGKTENYAPGRNFIRTEQQAGNTLSIIGTA